MADQEGGKWPSFGTIFGVLAFAQSIMNAFLPYELRSAFMGVGVRVYRFFSNYVSYVVEESDGVSLNELYNAVSLHLSDAAAREARSAKLALRKNASDVTYGPAENETVADRTFPGATVWWRFLSEERRHQSFSWEGPLAGDYRRSLHLLMRKRDRDRNLLPAYLQHVRQQAAHVQSRIRDRQLYTNIAKPDFPFVGPHIKAWESVPFKHPSTFDTLALDPSFKQKIIDDLTDFANGKLFYQRVGRAWKRGYLLYGPPGTGKSSMIAAIANFLQYDVYDLELTEVKSNAALRNLLIKTTDKSVVVIEDIDCSLDLSDRKKKKKPAADEDDKSNTEKLKMKIGAGGDNSIESKVTLSGLLNFTDGLWSCCGNERLFVFTTNHVERLDPALLRPGRMDMHIHLGYCGFEAFKVIAKNYLGLEGHPLFEDVEAAMAEDGAHLTPAEVCEVLTREKRDVEEALTCLVSKLRESKLKKDVEREEEEQEEHRDDPSNDGDHHAAGLMEE